MDTPTRPLPELTEPDSAPFWHATRRGVLSFQRCTECASVVFPPRQHCPACAGLQLERLESSGSGTVHTYTTTHVHSHPYFKARGAYTIGLIDLDEGFRILAELTPEVLEVGPGARVHVTWEQYPDVWIPIFALGDDADRRNGEDAE